MAREIPVFTERDVTLSEVLASLAEHSDDRKRAAHLVEPARNLGARISQSLPEPEPMEVPA